MVSNHKPTGRSISMPAGLAKGAALAMGVTIAGCALIAKAVEKELLEEEKIGYAIMVMLILASYTGAIYSYKKIKRRRLPVCMFSGVIYLCLLMVVTVLFFGGQFSAVGETGLLIICGSFLASMPVTMKKSRKGKGKIKISNR